MTLSERPSGPVPGRTPTPSSARRTRRVRWTALVTWAVLVAVLVGLPGLETLDEAAPATLPGPGSAAFWGCLVTVTLQAAALLGAARAPRAVPVVVAALAVPLAAAGTGDLFSITSGAVTVAVVLAVLARPLTTLVVPLVGTALLVTVGEAVNALVAGTSAAGAAVTTGLLQAVGAVVVPLLVGLVVVARRDAREARREEAQAVVREQDALVRAAVADERTAMARELHDIAAHHLSSMALMTAAIDRQIDTDPEAAKRGVRQVRAQSTAMLDDLRRLVGLLRDDAADADAVETVATVPELVATARAAGRAVDLRLLDADADGVGPLAQLVVHRMVQEALANAAAHAPGAACVVELDGRDPDRFVAVVRNTAAAAPPPSPTGGFGLVGMRERAELVGGALDAGADPEGGWTVRLQVPRDRAGQAAA